MTKKEFIAKIKEMGFTEYKFLNTNAPEYFYIVLQYVKLSVTIMGKTVRIFVINKKDLDFMHSVLLKETDKIDEKFLNSVKKLVNLFA